MGMSPISSRRSVPPLAISKSPGFPPEFAPENAPCWLDVPVSQINWGYEPLSGIVAREHPLCAMPIGPRKTVRFLPYGSTNIRLTELPQAEHPQADHPMADHPDA